MNVKSIIKKIIFFPRTAVNYIILKAKHVKFGKNLSINGKLFVSVKENGSIKIGDNVRLNSSPSSNPTGGNVKTFFQVLGDGKLTIGDNTGISNVAFTCCDKIEIGSNVLIGAGCRIFDTDFHPVDPTYRLANCNDREHTAHRPIIIEDNVFVGAGSIILKGTQIGSGSVIGAGSVVAGKIPPNEVWAGNPARKIR